MEDLIEFYGTECIHCREMDPLIRKLEEEEGIKIEKLEVWHDTNNLNLMREFDQGFCGGVPFFYNKKTKKWICGSTSYEELKNWAIGK